MSLPQLASDFMSIVIRGKFDLSGVSPTWLSEIGLIGDNEVRQASYEMLIPGEISIFSVGTLRFEIQSEAFQIATRDEDFFERLRDIALGVLNAFPDTPLQVMGFNRHANFAVEKLDDYHRIGDILAPKDPWLGVLDLAGMMGVRLWGARPDMFGGRTEIRVEPSGLLRQGILVLYNDHFDLTVVDKRPTTREEAALLNGRAAEFSPDKWQVAVDILIGEWGSSLARAAVAIEHVGSMGRVK